MKYTFYVLKKIFVILIGAVVFFSLMLNLIDLLTNITKYLSLKVSTKDIMRVMLYYTPKTVWYAVPMGFLFSITFVVSDMYAHNEMIATFVSGISLKKFSFPILVAGLGLSVGMFYFENKIVVPYYDKKTELQDRLLNVVKDANNSNVIVISDGGKIIYFADRYNDDTKSLDGVYLVFRDENKKLESIVKTSYADWDDEAQKWILGRAIQYLRKDDSFEIVPFNEEYAERLTENYTIFRHSSVDVSTVDVQVAKEYIDHLRKAGLPYSNELSEYYKKYAFPLIVFITGFLAIGLCGKTKKNHLLIGLAMAVFAIVIFYVFQSITMVLAKNGFISPIMGAWLPDVLFVFIAFLLLAFSRS